MAKNIAVILIRGPVHVDRQVKDTLCFLRLCNKNVCTITEDSPTVKGMIERCKDYITWGEISDDCAAALKKARGESYTTKEGKKAEKKFFRLHPPRGGFERRGIKVPYNLGGALGYRGDKINDLIKKML